MIRVRLSHPSYLKELSSLYPKAELLTLLRLVCGCSFYRSKTAPDIERQFVVANSWILSMPLFEFYVIRDDRSCGMLNGVIQDKLRRDYEFGLPSQDFSRLRRNCVSFRSSLFVLTRRYCEELEPTLGPVQADKRVRDENGEPTYRDRTLLSILTFGLVIHDLLFDFADDYVKRGLGTQREFLAKSNSKDYCYRNWMNSLLGYDWEKVCTARITENGKENYLGYEDWDGEEPLGLL